MKVPTKGYYRLKSGHGTLCFRVLNCGYLSHEKGYAKIKIDWWNECSGAYWANQYGLPRNWKITEENFNNFEKFYPKWAIHVS